VYLENQNGSNLESNLGILGVNLEKSFNNRLDKAVSINELKSWAEKASGTLRLLNQYRAICITLFFS